MPKIRIIGKLPKADVGFNVNPGYDWTNFNPNPYTPTYANTFGQPQPFPKPALAAQEMNKNTDIPNISFKSPTDVSDPGMDFQQPEEDVKAIKAENKQEQNRQNWLKDPRNEMATTGPGQDFYKGTGITAPKYDASKKYNKKGQETKPFDINKGLNNMSKISQGIQTGISTVGAGVNLYDNWKKQKEYDKAARNSRLPDNYYAVNTSVDRGDYDINDGMFRPNELGYKSKGTQANAYYAQQNFTRYGGMIKAAEGMLVPGDEIVQRAYLPSLPTINIPTAPPPSVSMSVPVAAAPRSSNSVKLKGNDVATRTNNPGNLLYKPIFGKLFGAVDSGIKQVDGSGTFAAFPDVETGLKAREAQMFGAVDGTFNTKIYKPNITVDEALRKWSNNGYTGRIYPQIANKTLAQVTPEERRELLKRQIKSESGSMYKQLTNAGLLEEGGEHIKTNNMRIRVTGLPETDQMADGGQPPYSGQSNYGLYIGQRNLYKTMAKHPFDDPGKTVTEEEPTADNPHVLEAEGRGSGKAGETILRPDGTHMNIVGPKHSEGGVKLTKEQAPEGSFIYSDTRKMKIKDPELLSHFNKGGKTKGGGITPAEIAKQYDTNKYRAILNDPTADPLQKSTAKKMLESYERKLAELALVQEGMKGFPQGIPEAAKSIVPQQQGRQQSQSIGEYGGYFQEGGMPSYQTGGGCPPGYQWEPGPDGEGGQCVKLPEEYVPPAESITPAGSPIMNQMPFLGTQINNNGKPIGLGFNLDKSDRFNLSGGYRGNIQDGKLAGSMYNLRASFPQIFGKDRGVDVSGNFGQGNLKIGANTQFPFLKGTLSVKGDYNQNVGNQPAAQPGNPNFMMTGEPSRNRGNVNVGAEYNTKIGKTNLKISGYYGDQPHFDPGGQYDPFGVGAIAEKAKAGTLSKTYPSWFNPWTKSNTPAGSISPTGQPTVFDPNNPNPFYTHYDKWKALNNNQDFAGPEEFQNFIYDYANTKDPKAVDAMWDKWGTTNKGKTIPKEERTKKAFADKFFGARTADLMGIDTDIPIVPRSKGKGSGQVTVIPEIEESAPPATIPGTPTVPGGDPEASGTGKAGWTSQDLRNRNNALIDYATLEKYHGYAPTIQPVLPSFIPQDWRGYAATQQANANAQAQMLGTYQPGQGMASNLSFLAGQQAGNLGDYISKVDQYNASGASNMDLQRANILNQYTQANAAARKNLWDEENVYDDRYRSAERGLRKGIVAAQNAGEDTASKLYNENLTQKYFKIDPYTQRMKFNPQGGKAAWEAATKGGYADPQTAADIYNSTYKSVNGNDEAKREAAMLAMRDYLGGDGGRETTSTYPNAPKKNSTKVTKEVKYGGTPNLGYAYFNPFLR